MISIATVLVSIFCLTVAAPAVKYDQRQEGDVNIRADLENFVILIIPTSGTANMGLLDILSKSIIPGKGLMNRKKNHNNGENKRQSQQPLLPQHQQETQHFIESKTAPYHVDISRTRSHLAKLHPQLQQSLGEVLIAHSPTVALKNENSVKSDEDKSSSHRSSRTLHISPNEDFQALVVSSDLFVGRKDARTDRKKVLESKSKSKKENLVLLGAEMDQCAPDQKRDALGICQIVKE